MTYALVDLSLDQAAPVELYEFVDGGRAWRYTNSAYQITYGGQTYLPESIGRSSVTREAGSLAGNIQVTVGDLNAFALELYAGLSSRPVAVTIRQGHLTDGAGEFAVIFRGLAAGVHFSGAQATITCGPRYTLSGRRKVPILSYQAGCNWEWAGAGCGLDREAFATTGTVMRSEQSGRTMYAGVLAGAPDGNYSGGYVQRASTGETRFIESQTGGYLKLTYPFASVAVGGESFKFYPGCRKTETDCSGRFNNLPQFLGWPRLPGVNPFNQSAYYLGGVTAAPDPGDTFDMPGWPGYQMIARQRWLGRVDSLGSSSGSTMERFEIYAMVDGTVRLWTKRGSGVQRTLILGAGFGVNPKPAPAGSTAQYEYLVTFPVQDEGGTPIAFADSRGFDVWHPWNAVSPVTPFILFQNNQFWHPGKFWMTFKVRDIATGVIRVQAMIYWRDIALQASDL